MNTHAKDNDNDDDDDDDDNAKSHFSVIVELAN